MVEIITIGLDIAKSVFQVHALGSGDTIPNRHHDRSPVAHIRSVSRSPRPSFRAPLTRNRPVAHAKVVPSPHSS